MNKKTSCKFINYIKRTLLNKLISLILVVGGALVLWLEEDATALIFLSFFAVPLFFTKENFIR